MELLDSCWIGGKPLFLLTHVLASLLIILVCTPMVQADPPGKQAYLTDCAKCHGTDGTGNSPRMRDVPGYVSVDLTKLSAANDGKFPRQEVYDAIDGRKRFSAHFIGDMPIWGLKYQDQNGTAESEAKVRQRISALVNYIESLQAKQLSFGTGE
jgi:mono/diheme cytochrome c family protein